mmetsp:Transcript_23433/g.59795  ORF Transcript_23433/g.59795 Transcript_23433/m.59795 type:complete len:215 (+) Transcript_23433:327-971(+)
MCKGATKVRRAVKPLTSGSEVSCVHPMQLTICRLIVNAEISGGEVSFVQLNKSSLSRKLREDTFGGSSRSGQPLKLSTWRIVKPDTSGQCRRPGHDTLSDFTVGGIAATMAAASMSLIVMPAMTSSSNATQPGRTAAKAANWAAPQPRLMKVSVGVDPRIAAPTNLARSAGFGSIAAAALSAAVAMYATGRTRSTDSTDGKPSPTEASDQSPRS